MESKTYKLNGKELLVLVRYKHAKGDQKIPSAVADLRVRVPPLGTAHRCCRATGGQGERIPPTVGRRAAIFAQRIISSAAAR